MMATPSWNSTRRFLDDVAYGLVQVERRDAAKRKSGSDKKTTSPGRRIVRGPLHSRRAPNGFDDSTRTAGSVLVVATGMIVPVAAQPVDPAVAVVCGSKPGERQTCAADTTGGVTLVRSTGTVACELGTSWGFDEKSIWVRDGCSAEFSLGKKPAGRQGFGTYTPGRGLKVADTEKGDLNIRVYTYVRYLNQRALDATYTDSFGTTKSVQQRQDFQVNKAIVFFNGWAMSPKLNYSVYVWTTNTSQGLGAQVVVAGFLAYAFNPHVTLGAGISGLPGARSTEGQWPNWLGTDQRLIADEFFRPSYTTGLFARGEIAKGLRYSVMWGNNLSQLGTDAGQLANDMNTVSGSLVWMPTTGEFGTDEQLRGLRGPRRRGHPPRHPLHVQRRRQAGAARHGGARQRADPPVGWQHRVCARTLRAGHQRHQRRLPDGVARCRRQAPRVRARRRVLLAAAEQLPRDGDRGAAVRPPHGHRASSCRRRRWWCRRPHSCMCPAPRSSATTASRPTCASASTSSRGRTRWSAGTRNCST